MTCTLFRAPERRICQLSEEGEEIVETIGYYYINERVSIEGGAKRKYEIN